MNNNKLVPLVPLRAALGLALQVSPDSKGSTKETKEAKEAKVANKGRVDSSRTLSAIFSRNFPNSLVGGQARGVSKLKQERAKI